jgi:ring-1,2-phenylacetyl-CoA epoxidase subunit PaaE
VPTARIHVERFGVAGPAPAHRVEPGDAPHAIIEVVIDGTRREVEFFESDPSTLDAALRAGIELPYSCRAGMCCTCRARVLSGQVRMDKNYSLEPRDLEAGFVLTCQAHPLTERVVISFDDR